MGYLSQRKSEKRENIILKALLCIIFVLFVLVFFDSSSETLLLIDSSVFYLYFCSLILFIYCLYKKYFFYAFGYMILFIMGFFVIETSANIFHNISYDSQKEIKVIYGREIIDFPKFLKKHDKKSDYIYMSEKGNAETYTKHGFLKKGQVRLSPKRKANFLLSQLSDKSVMLVFVDFEGIEHNEIEGVFTKLTQFINGQEYPTIVVGDFGIPAWTDPFKEFANKTQLEVKNKMIFSRESFFVNPFKIPTVNVLGYKNMGIKDIRFFPRDKSGKNPILFDLSY